MRIALTADNGMYNPFKEVMDEEDPDSVLISRSLQGDRPALESLILRHQSWIYNIAIRMVFDPHDAEDITQEVLIKVITKLSLFDPSKSAFRTWLYRIVVNHIINVKTSRKETIVAKTLKSRVFEDYASNIPDRRRSFKPGSDLMLREVKHSCLHCILLCLNRRERIVFILGAIFSVSDGMGGEICDISKANYRKILSRTRNKLADFFRANCSLLKEGNPCRCEDKIEPMQKIRLVDAENLLTGKDAHGKVSDVLASTLRHLEDSYYEYVSLFRDQPFLKAPDMVKWLRNLLNGEDIKTLFQMAKGI